MNAKLVSLSGNMVANGSMTKRKRTARSLL
jgi:hypothetical protein